MNLIEEYYKLDERRAYYVTEYIRQVSDAGENEEELKQFIQDLKSGRLRNKENIELDIIFPNLENLLKNAIETILKTGNIETITEERLMKISNEEKIDMIKYLEKEPKAKNISKFLKAMIEGKIKDGNFDLDGFTDEEMDYLQESYYYTKKAKPLDTIKTSEFIFNYMRYKDCMISITSYDELIKVINIAEKLDEKSNITFILNNKIATGNAGQQESEAIRFTNTKIRSENMKKYYIESKVPPLKLRDLQIFARKVNKIMELTEGISDTLDLINILSVVVFNNEGNTESKLENAIKNYNEGTAKCIDKCVVLKIIMKMKNLKTKIMIGITENKMFHSWIQVFYNGDWRNVDCTNLQKTLDNNSHMNTTGAFLSKNGLKLKDESQVSDENKEQISSEEIMESMNRIKQKVRNNELIPQSSGR